MAFGIGLIGAGGNQKLRHIPGFREIDDVEIVNVVNRSRASGEAVAAEYGIPAVSESVYELLADPAVDAVSIGTWPYKHLEFTQAALEAGKHVLCEARMASNAMEAEVMLALDRAHPDLVAQLVPAPFDFRLGKTITRMCADGSLGDILEAHLTLLNGSGLDASAPLHWRHRSDYSGKNMMQLGIFNETIQRWLGDTTRVIAHARAFVNSRVDAETGAAHNIVIPDSLGIFADMANGARCTYRVSAITQGAPQPPSIDIYGSEGCLHWRFGDTAEWARHGDDLQSLEPDEGTAHGWQVEADFIRSVREGAPITLTNFADGVRYMRFTDAVWESWNSGQAQEIEPLAD